MKFSYCPNVDDATAPVLRCGIETIPSYVDEYQMYAGQITPGYVRSADVGISPVNYDALVAVQAFSRLKRHAKLVVETPSSKGWDTTGEQSREWALQQLEAVDAAEGEIAAFTLDEPLTGTPIELQPLADVTAQFKHLCDVQDVGCYLIEAFPYNTAESILAFLEALKERDALPTRFVWDIWYPNIVEWLGRQVAIERTTRQMRELGVQEIAAIVCGHGQMADQPAYAKAAREMNRFWRQVEGLDRIVVQSWHELAGQDREKTLLTVPTCCPREDDSSHLAILQDVADSWTAIKPDRYRPR